MAAIGFVFGAFGATPFTALQLPQGAHHPVLSPDGATLLFSADNHCGLKALDLVDGKISIIDSDAAAGFQPVFSTDGNTVYYRTAETRDGLLYRDLRSYSFVNGKSKRLAAPTRKDIDIASMAHDDFAVADYREIRVRRGATENRISPLADSHSYLWASLSADGSKVLFTEPFKGVYISNADGSEPKRLLAKGDFASWAGDNTIIAVVTHDDGYVVTDSKLVAVDISTGSVTVLTPDDMLVGEASAALDGTVVFSDIEGNMFIFNTNDL